MRIILIFVSIIVAFHIVQAWRSYEFLKSDIGLLTDQTCLNILSRHVLGRQPYKETCKITSYEVDMPAVPDVGETALIKFKPIAGMEEQCPPISVLTDRRSAEVWITTETQAE